MGIAIQHGDSEEEELFVHDFMQISSEEGAVWNIKDLMSPIPLNCVRKAFILALNDSADAFVCLSKSS